MKKNEVDQKGQQITVHYTTVNNYLKAYFGKPRKIRKAFYLTKDKWPKGRNFGK